MLLSSGLIGCGYPGRDLGPVPEPWFAWWRDNKKGLEIAKEAPTLEPALQKQWERYWGLGDKAKEGEGGEGRGRKRGGDKGGSDKGGSDKGGGESGGGERKGGD